MGAAVCDIGRALVRRKVSYVSTSISQRRVVKSKEDAAVGGNEEGEGKCANSIYYS